MDHIDTTRYIEFIRESRILNPNKHYDYVERLLGLSGEVGELMEIYKKELRDSTPRNREDVINELGDVLYYLYAIIDKEGLTVEEIIKYNMSKLTQRAIDRREQRDKESK